jgi:hypothetical protein
VIANRSEILNQIIEQLRLIDEGAIRDGVSHIFLQVEKVEGINEIRINGNAEGLIHFAMAVLDLAVSDVKGAHHHFDESGVVDPCDVPLVVSLKAAPWNAE